MLLFPSYGMGPPPHNFFSFHSAEQMELLLRALEVLGDANALLEAVLEIAAPLLRDPRVVVGAAGLVPGRSCAAFGSFGLIAADTKKYRVDLEEPVYDETFTPRADFFTAEDA